MPSIVERAGVFLLILTCAYAARPLSVTRSGAKYTHGEGNRAAVEAVHTRKRTIVRVGVDPRFGPQVRELRKAWARSGGFFPWGSVELLARICYRDRISKSPVV